MIDHKAIERERERERERDERSQGNIEMRYIKAVCIYIYKEKTRDYRKMRCHKAVERDERSQGSKEVREVTMQ